MECNPLCYDDLPNYKVVIFNSYVITRDQRVSSVLNCFSWDRTFLGRSASTKHQPIVASKIGSVCVSREISYEFTVYKILSNPQRCWTVFPGCFQDVFRMDLSQGLPLFGILHIWMHVCVYIYEYIYIHDIYMNIYIYSIIYSLYIYEYIYIYI